MTARFMLRGAALHRGTVYNCFAGFGFARQSEEGFIPYLTPTRSGRMEFHNAILSLDSVGRTDCGVCRR